MAKHKKFIKLHKTAAVSLLLIVALFVIPPLAGASFIVSYYQRIYPQVFINDINVGGLSKKQAITLINQRMKIPSSLQISVESSSGTKRSKIDTKDIDAHINIDAAVEKAYEVGRQGNLYTDARAVIQNMQSRTTVPVEVEFDDTALSTIISALSEQTGTPPSQPRFLLKNGDVQLTNGIPGDELPIEYVKQSIVSALTQGSDHVELHTKVTDTRLTDPEAESAVKRAQALLNKKLILTLENESVQTLKIDKLLPFLNAQGGYKEFALRNTVKDIAQSHNKEVMEPIFNFDGKRVTEFTPGEEGVLVDQELLYQNLSIALSTLEQTNNTEISVEIPHESTKPQTAISDVNNLGIKELLGKGTSRFSGSIPSRVYNVSLASSRINGVLVAPNETFSFSSAIGDISKYTGYKEAYIIQDGKTILGDGGGVCQVSTTLFRAVMNAGLPIVERHAHAYRVGYYEQDAGPGLDATVFVPSVDFKFLNDTGNYILIKTSVDSKNMTADFRIYGTSDGRKATITKPVVTDQIAPPDDLYIDEPTLPAGKVVQLEHRAWGARVSFTYSVQKDNQEIYHKNFVSVYQPWQAVYQRGVGPS